MAKQITKKQQVSNQVAVSKLDNQAAKVKVNPKVANLEVDLQATKLEATTTVKPEVIDQPAEIEAKQQATKPNALNPAAEQEANHQEVKSEVTPPIHVYDFLWDEWLNTVKLGQAFQREMEGMAFKAIEQQKDIWIKSIENFERVENEIHKFTDSTTSYFMESWKHLGDQSFSQNVEEWNKQVEEISNGWRKQYGTSGYATSNLVGKSFEQMDSTLKLALEQQNKTREEAQQILEKLVDQVKASNKVFLDTWENNQNSFVK